jgi:hypothetical protein
MSLPAPSTLLALSPGDDHIRIPATQPEQTSRLRQSGTGVSAPYRTAISAASGSTWRRHDLHQTTRRTPAAAALPSDIGGPVYDFMSRAL